MSGQFCLLSLGSQPPSQAVAIGVSERPLCIYETIGPGAGAKVFAVAGAGIVAPWSARPTELVSYVAVTLSAIDYHRTRTPRGLLNDVSSTATVKPATICQAGARLNASQEIDRAAMCQNLDFRSILRFRLNKERP